MTRVPSWDQFDKPGMRCEIGEHEKCMFQAACPCDCHPKPESPLRAVAAYLHPHIEAEVARLYALERDHQHAVEEMADLRRQLHRATTMAGELRSRLTKAEARLEDLRPDEISKARRDALFNGAGFIKVTSLGRQQYSTEHVPAEQVSIRG